MLRLSSLSSHLHRSLTQTKRTMSTNPHTVFAKSAFSISGSEGLYDRARPGYPQPALAHILSLLPSSSPPRIIELGAGTGLFTRGLLGEAAEAKSFIKEEKGGKGGKLTCVEPAEGMRESFKKKLEEGREEGSLKDVDVEIVDGTFEKIPVEDHVADLIIVAQAFHWIGHDGLLPMTEISRVLKTGGKGALCLIWNQEDRDKVEWVRQLREGYEAFEAGTPQFVVSSDSDTGSISTASTTGDTSKRVYEFKDHPLYRLNYWRTIFDLPLYSTNFSPPELTHYERSLPTTDQLVIDRVLSKSYITALPKEKKDIVVKNIKEIVERGDGRVWLDEKEGVYEYPYKTDLYVIKRK